MGNQFKCYLRSRISGSNIFAGMFQDLMTVSTIIFAKILWKGNYVGTNFQTGNSLRFETRPYSPYQGIRRHMLDFFWITWCLNSYLKLFYWLKIVIDKVSMFKFYQDIFWINECGLKKVLKYWKSQEVCAWPNLNQIGVS